MTDDQSLITQQDSQLANASVQELERMAAEQGITLTVTDERAIAARQREKRKVWEDEDAIKARSQSPVVRFSQSFNRSYPGILNTTLAIGAVLTTFFQTLLISVGIPAILGLLLIVEQQRVYQGMMLFDAAEFLAQLGAVAVVISNLGFEFAIEFVEQQTQWKQPQQFKPTLKSSWAAFRYYFAFWEQWNPQSESPAKRYRQLQRLTTITILALSVGGSMHAAITSTSGTWVQGILSIVQDSTLAQMFAWVGGALFAVMAVLGAQGFSRFIAERNAAFLVAMTQTKDVVDLDRERDLDEIRAMYVRAKMQHVEQERSTKTGAGTINPTIAEQPNRPQLGFSQPQPSMQLRLEPQ